VDQQTAQLILDGGTIVEWVTLLGSIIFTVFMAGRFYQRNKHLEAIIKSHSSQFKEIEERFKEVYAKFESHVQTTAVEIKSQTDRVMIATTERVNAQATALTTISESFSKALEIADQNHREQVKIIDELNRNQHDKFMEFQIEAGKNIERLLTVSESNADSIKAMAGKIDTLLERRGSSRGS
jgi:hypothetical protein